ncbi:uncharacterized protein LOC136089751 [Hydra vulgaris]|uniref:Uncharacterized protein LOC136089751 n=1 Tax=Hydra vulgaris TaxID=6087 RepID=A0ABM4DBY9_HYDVU
MDIITNIETCALQLEKLKKPTQAETLRQHCTGYALLNQNDASLKLEEQIKNSKIIDYDPTSTLTTKFQRQLCKLRKEGKLDTNRYFKMYPSDCNQPRIYGMNKAHKPEKDYPMRPVVSTINTPPYGTSDYLVKIIQPTLNKNKSRLMNSNSFVSEAKQWIIDHNEVQVSFDIVYLYPFIPIDETIPVIIDILNADIVDLKTRTKLTLADIHQVIELSLSICYFLYENNIRVIPNSGPIGLSLMVVMAEAFLQNIERKSLNIAIVYTSEPKIYKRYVDDCHARFASIKQQQMFLNILREQHPAIKYTVELENDLKQLNFLDINITNTGSGAYEFQIHRKEAITNVQLKPNSNINPNIIIGVFKGFLCRAKRICSQKHLQKKIDFLIDIRRLCENELKTHAPAKKPILNERLRTVRCQWAQDHLHWTFEDWTRIAFSDESSISLSSNSVQYVRCHTDERYDDKCVLCHEKRSRGNCMIWGAFTVHDYTPLYRVIHN